MRARTNLDPREFACVHTHKWKRSFLRAFACVRLRACYRAGLIKSQNAFACKKSQNSNALWVQKLSGCTICNHSKQKQMYSIMVCTHKTYVQSAAGVEYERECLRKSLITCNSCLCRNYKCRGRDRSAGREHGTAPPYTHHTSSHKSKT